MFRPLTLAMLLATPAAAQDLGCPVDVSSQLYALTLDARAGVLAPEALGQNANEIARACGSTRVIMSQFLAMFTAAGLATPAPDADRYNAHANALRTLQGLARGGDGPFEPVAVTGPDGPAEWTVQDERNAAWDLGFAMASDFLTHGVHADLFTPGRTEIVGCGLYPAEELSALATLARDGGDSGELVVRVHYLASQCDDEDHEAAGQAAAYFAAHYEARRADPEGYIGLTGRDIRSGLTRFLETHLAGRAESPLFTETQIKDYLAD